jgi:hypothetical protein
LRSKDRDAISYSATAEFLLAIVSKKSAKLRRIDVDDDHLDGR